MARHLAAFMPLLKMNVANSTTKICCQGSHVKRVTLSSAFAEPSTQLTLPLNVLEILLLGQISLCYLSEMKHSLRPLCTRLFVSRAWHLVNEGLFELCNEMVDDNWTTTFCRIE